MYATRHDKLKSNGKVIIITTILLLITVGICVYQFYMKNYEDGFLCILAIAILLLPLILDYKSGIRFPGLLQLCILIFVFSSQILGEMFQFYARFPLWDSILHTFSGLIAAAIGYSLFNILSDEREAVRKLRPSLIIIFTLCFSSFPLKS